MRAQSPMPVGACSARSASSSLTGRLLFLLLLAPAFAGCENPQEPLDRPAPTAPDAPLIADERTLLLLPFNADLTGEEGEEPTEASGVTFEPGIAGSGALINGSDRLAYSGAGNVNAEAGTIEFWIKPRWNGNDHSNHIFLALGLELLVLKDGADNLRFLLGPDDSEAYQAYSIAHWDANEWHHVAVTWTVPGVMKTYVDAVEVISHPSSAQDHITQIPAELYVGNRGGLDQADGVMDQLRISDVARTAQEIAESYLEALSPLVLSQVTTGALHSCGITSEGRAYCWGANWSGQLGDGTNTDRPAPVAVEGGLTFRELTAGYAHTCGVTTDDRAYCWGLNTFGELGDGTTDARSTPVQVQASVKFHQVDAGSGTGRHTCGLSEPDRRAYCWGYNETAQLGIGTATGPETCSFFWSCSTRPVAVLGGRVFRRVSAGGGHTCAVTPRNRAYCWGWNQSGQVGDSTEVRKRPRPRLVAGGYDFHHIDVGREHTCGVTTDRQAYCWGNGRLGQLGNGKTYLSFWPRRVAGSLGFDRVTTGDLNTCAETTTNRAYCWGENGAGQLGIGTATGPQTCYYDSSTPTPCSTRPVAVAGGLSFAQLAAGGAHMCGRSVGGVTYCWGSNTHGQVGDGSDEDVRFTPVPIAGAR